MSNHFQNNQESVASRNGFTATDVVEEVWKHLGLPNASFKALTLVEHDGPVLPSSFKIGILAQATTALAALTAALNYAVRNKLSSTPQVSVSSKHAVAEFMSQSLYRLEPQPQPAPWSSLGGLHKTSDGYVRIHSGFPNHAYGTLELLGLPKDASREDVASKVAQWTSIDLETKATAEGNLAIYALRSYEQWDLHPQARATSTMPVCLKQLALGSPKALAPSDSNKCLRGLRVVEMSRVIAAPVAGRTLAAHGADVIWITSPNLPDLPTTDPDVSRGKRTVQLDICKEDDRERLMELLRTCDVFIQGYRPESLARRGLSPEELSRLNPNIICANLSAFGPHGPWASRRGFDSLVQTCSGMNISEARHAGQGEAARPMPCQALDHASGYLLATGIMAALYHRATNGGSWQVDVSLAGTMQYLRSLGQYPASTGFEGRDMLAQNELPEEFFETRSSGLGLLRAVRHSPSVDGCEVGWDIMPKPLGSDKPEWL